jgi:hypothetical protein
VQIANSLFEIGVLPGCWLKSVDLVPFAVEYCDEIGVGHTPRPGETLSRICQAIERTHIENPSESELILYGFKVTNDEGLQKQIVVSNRTHFDQRRVATE